MPDLISAIHGCALQTENWPDALEAMLGHVGGREGMLWSHPATPDAFGLRVTCRLPPESLADDARGFEQHEAWTQAGLAKGLRAGEMLADKHLLLAMLHRQSDTDVMSATPTVCLAMLRGRADAPFGAVERKKLLALLPHLQHATAVNFQMAERERRLSVAQMAVDLFCDALFFADRSGQIVHTNEAARALLAERDGLCLRHHRLLTDNPDENRLLQDLFGSRESGVGSRESGVGSRESGVGSRESAGSLRLTRPSGKQAFVATRVKAAGCTRPDAAYLPHQVVLIHDPEANMPARVTAIRARYALTATECQVVAALLKTGSAHAAAQHLGLSDNTMKTHLKSVFNKTGAHRQSELIQLMLSFPRL